ncbi:MAG: hypothetical protein HY711_08140 [Candidatus Melainabacteria bacterium]|nr:hypothetical protein [Candidatus Melainabacteria bacterium]
MYIESHYILENKSAIKTGLRFMGSHPLRPMIEKVLRDAANKDKVYIDDDDIRAHRDDIEELLASGQVPSEVARKFRKVLRDGDSSDSIDCSDCSGRSSYSRNPGYTGPFEAIGDNVAGTPGRVLGACADIPIKVVDAFFGGLFGGGSRRRRGGRRRYR